MDGFDKDLMALESSKLEKDKACGFECGIYRSSSANKGADLLRASN